MASGGRRPRIVIATRSRHKLAELAELLRPARAELVTLDALGIEGDPVEDGLTFEANARLKARFYARLSGLPTLADDSGIEVDALGGAPGVRTRRYAGENATDLENNAKLLRRIGRPAGRPSAARATSASSRSSSPTARAPRVACRSPPRRAARSADGSPTAPRGSGGFGYDPIFEPAGEPPGGRTLGQQSAAEKAAISHRARAARRMGRRLAALGY